MYDEAFELMILTGLFAPGTVSATAAQGWSISCSSCSRQAFDAWVKGNVGERIFEPWGSLLARALPAPELARCIARAGGG